LSLLVAPCRSSASCSITVQFQPPVGTTAPVQFDSPTQLVRIISIDSPVCLSDDHDNDSSQTISVIRH
ncbi:hypothetical protein CLOM_g2268, partial [Closterium sp. NIES-68]